MDVHEEILALRRRLERANFLYYVKDAPEISDFEYDALLRRLEELEAAHPEYASPDSPTQHVGGYALNTFAQVHHQVPLESLQDVFSFDELRAFGTRMITLSSRRSTVYPCRSSMKTVCSCAVRRAVTVSPART